MEHCGRPRRYSRHPHPVSLDRPRRPSRGSRSRREPHVRVLGRDRAASVGKKTPQRAWTGETRLSSWVEVPPFVTRVRCGSHVLTLWHRTLSRHAGGISYRKEIRAGIATSGVSFRTVSELIGLVTTKQRYGTGDFFLQWIAILATITRRSHPSEKAVKGAGRAGMGRAGESPNGSVGGTS